MPSSATLNFGLKTGIFVGLIPNLKQMVPESGDLDSIRDKNLPASGTVAERLTRLLFIHYQSVTVHLHALHQ